MIPAWDSELLSVLNLPVAEQPTDDSMTVCNWLVGTSAKERTTTTRVGEQDSPLTNKHLETTLLSDTSVEPIQGGTVYTSNNINVI